MTHSESRGARRWVVLVLMSLVIFANYYLYDSFSTLKSTLQTELGATSTHWGLVRNFYNVPNTFLFMALLGGIFLDRFGIRRTGFIFTVLCVLGGIVTAYGTSDTFRTGGLGYGVMAAFLPEYSPELKMMMLGRLLFGLGAETQIVMLNKVLAKWFLGKELALAFGLNLGFARVGSALGMSMSPRISAGFGFTSALWLGALVMTAGLVLFLVFMVIDKREDARGPTTREEARRSEYDGVVNHDLVHLSDLVTLVKSRTYLLVALLCASFYGAVFPFQDFLADLLEHEYGYENVVAGAFTSLIPWGAAVFTIIFGAIIDKKGLRTTLMLGGAGLLLLTQLAFAFTHVTPWLLVPLFGVAFSLVPAAMWPAVALIVDERRLGTAYGFMTWLQNLAWWGVPLAAGALLDSTNPDVTPQTLAAGTAVYDYTATMVMFAGLGILAVAFAILLRMADRGPHGRGLELPSAEAAAFNASTNQSGAP